MSAALTRAAAASQGDMSMPSNLGGSFQAQLSVLSKHVPSPCCKPLGMTGQLQRLRRWCSADCYICWFFGAVSVRSLNTLCTCGLGGARLNICAAPAMA